MEMWQRGNECDGEWCDKTRKGEFAATVLAGFFFIVVVAVLMPGIIAMRSLDWAYRKIRWES